MLALIWKAAVLVEADAVGGCFQSGMVNGRSRGRSQLGSWLRSSESKSNPPLIAIADLASSKLNDSNVLTPTEI